MYPTLGPQWDLTVEQNRAYVHRVSDGQRVAGLTPAEAVVLSLMDGSRAEPVLNELIATGLGEPYLVVLQSMTGRLQSLLTDGPVRTYPYPMDRLAQIDAPDNDEGLRPLPGPRVLHWWVTSVCPRRCVYCFANPILGTKAEDATLTRDQLQRIFTESAELGAEHLLVAGAEPLLRADLPEVMGDALAHGITPFLTTKYPITETLAGRLAQAGVRHISLSLDTMEAEESRVLIGSSTYPAVVDRSAKNLRQAGVAFSIQAVATKLNPGALRAVAAFAAEAGAIVLQVVPFEPVSTPIASMSNDAMQLYETTWLDDEVCRLSERYPSLNVEKFEELGSGSRSGYHCDIGMTKLFFLPNGLVHRCYKLTHDLSLCGKDLRETSVAAVWHDPQFRDIISPPHEAYAGSDCHACGRFARCHDDGRCIYQAARDRGSYEANDRDCQGPYMMPRPAGEFHHESLREV